MYLKTILFIFVVLIASSCTGRPQLGVKKLDLKKIDYKMDVSFFYSNAFEINAPYDESMDKFYLYEKEILKYYNTETAELYPTLIQYSNRGGWYDSDVKEAVFGKFSFYLLSMVTTHHDDLVLVNASTELNETGLSELEKILDVKYGNLSVYQVSERFGKDNHIRRWETPDEYIQLEASVNDGKGVLSIEIKDDIQELLKMGSPEPFTEIQLYIWKKEYHDLVLIHCPLNLSAFDGEREHYHARNADWYTPEVIRPFLITKNYLDSLAAQGDIRNTILLSYYKHIPDNTMIDHSEMEESVRLNTEGCLPYGYFGPLRQQFKGNLSNTQYMAQQMRTGKKFSAFFQDKELCKFWYMGEAEWKDKKKRAGIVYFHEEENGSLLAETDLNHYHTVHDFPLCLNELLEKSLQESGLNLEKTTACLVSLPPGYPGAYITDGKLEFFTPVMPEGGISIGEWYVGKLYPMLEVLDAIQ